MIAGKPAASSADPAEHPARSQNTAEAGQHDRRAVRLTPTGLGVPHRGEAVAAALGI